MKHRIRMRKLGRDSKHRWHMLRTMVDSLIQHQRIRTTEAKAKELRRVADWVVTAAKKEDKREARREVSRYLRTEESVETALTELAERYKHRPGGFTRILKVGWRKGDNANMAVIEFVDREGELRPAAKVDPEVAARGRAPNQVPRFRDLLPSRAWTVESSKAL